MLLNNNTILSDWRMFKMNVSANIGNMIWVYKENLRLNILGQSGRNYFYFLKGLRFAFNELGLSFEEIEKFDNEVYEKLINEGYSDLVESYKNEDYENNWNRS